MLTIRKNERSVFVLVIIFYLFTSGIMAQEKDTALITKNYKPVVNVYAGISYSDPSSQLQPQLFGISADISAGRRSKIPIDLQFVKVHGSSNTGSWPVLSINYKYYFSEKPKIDYYMQYGLGTTLFEAVLSASIGCNYYFYKSLGINANLTFQAVLKENDPEGIVSFRLGICF